MKSLSPISSTFDIIDVSLLCKELRIEMSKNKQMKKRQVSQRSSYIYTALGLLIAFISLISLFEAGFIGNIIMNTFRLVVGEAYSLLLFIIAIWGIKMIWFRNLVNISTIKFIGGILIFVSITLILHLQLFYPLEPLNDSIFRITYERFINEFVLSQNNISLGGGMLGAMLYRIFLPLLSRTGSIILAILLFFTGLFIMVNISTKMFFNALANTYQAMLNFFKDFFSLLSHANRQYKDLFDVEDVDIIENNGTHEAPSQNIESESTIYDQYTNPPTNYSHEEPSLDHTMHIPNYGNDYQLPRGMQSKSGKERNFKSFTKRDPIAQTASKKREDNLNITHQELDLDYFDRMNAPSRNRMNEVKPEITGFNPLEKEPEQLSSENLAPLASEDITMEEQPQAEEVLEHQSEVQESVKNSANRWQDQAHEIEDTTKDDLDDLLVSEPNTPSTTKTTKKHNDYQLPSKELLTKIPPVDQSEEYERINENIDKLELTFRSFGVDAKVVKANLGPAVTKYEIEPAIGVKVSKIVSLADDIALALAARDVRIEAPIPGKSLIGIEVPNIQVSPVSFWEIIDPALQSTKILEVPLGRDISGSVCLADLSKMPHLLIAGATGSGKSVGMNVIITSLLMKARPDEVKFLMIDPKKVELTMYNELPHLLAPVVTNPRKAAHALNNVVQEMEHRYELFATLGMRNIEGYNDAIKEINRKEQTNYQPLPKIVVFIDELADLMLVASNEVENAIIRLAQMARAAGIHMIIATQRPSVDVITGIIKANIPSRLAFAVSSGTDSRTILDTNGAEKLLGRGDMLFQPMGRSKPLRVQGAYISDDEVERITDFIREQSEPDYDEDIVVTNESMELAEASSDELFDEVVEMIKDEETISISQLQRKFRIGYNRAARLVDDLESLGYVTPQDGSKPRTVLIQ